MKHYDIKDLPKEKLLAVIALLVKKNQALKNQLAAMALVLREEE